MEAEFGIADPLHLVKLGVADGSGWAADFQLGAAPSPGPIKKT